MFSAKEIREWSSGDYANTSVGLSLWCGTNADRADMAMQSGLQVPKGNIADAAMKLGKQIWGAVSASGKFPSDKFRNIFSTYVSEVRQGGVNDRFIYTTPARYLAESYARGFANDGSEFASMVNHTLTQICMDGEEHLFVAQKSQPAIVRLFAPYSSMENASEVKELARRWAEDTWSLQHQDLDDYVFTHVHLGEIRLVKNVPSSDIIQVIYL